MELEKTKGQGDLNYRENVVADRQVIADGLLRFEGAIRSLPLEGRKDLVHFIIREAASYADCLS